MPASRPAFVAAIYPFMGAIPDITVPRDAPLPFVAAASDDGLSPHSVRIYQAWVAARKPAELHVYAKVGHGFGMRTQQSPVDRWADRSAIGSRSRVC